MKLSFTSSFLTILILVLTIFSNSFSQKLGKHTLEEWQTIIDTTWGNGLPTATKLQYFDIAWNTIDDYFPCFQNLDLDWNALKDLYRPEVEAGVSRGRFAAIMTYLGWAVQETHTYIVDTLVAWGTPLKPGVPLFVVASPGRATHFGAALSPLPDSSLLVIKSLPDHPIGLVPGDIILGYDGVPWKKLYKEILNAQVPLSPTGHPVSTKAAKIHNIMINAGMNWHLFDTLDVVKYTTGETMHYQTDLLEGQTGFIWANEQLPVPGVPWPAVNQGDNVRMTADLGDFISWGIVDGTQIGYIYLLSEWISGQPDLGSKFRSAIDSMMNYYGTTGLIIDLRLNIGGNISMPTSGLALLFNEYIKTVGQVKRCNNNDHFEMCPESWWPDDEFAIKGQQATFYDRPIAVLTGPGALSMGDFIPLQLKFHPMARLFGKPTAGAFSRFDTRTDHLPNSNWWFAYTLGNTYLFSDPENYLTHTELKIDEEVWLTQEDVAKGEDTVVKRAIEWIQNLAHTHDVVVDKTYHAPATGTVQILAQVENPNDHDLSVLAYVSNDTAVIDSVYFSENDSIWSTQWSVPHGEGIFHVSVKTEDPDAAIARTIPNVAHFTSAGPVILESYQISSGDTIPNPGDNLFFKLFLKNNGNIATIRNIEIKLTAIDTCAIPGASNQRFHYKIDSLAVGEIDTHNNSFAILINSACSEPLKIPVRVDIYEDAYLFWMDTLYIDLVPTGITGSGPDIPYKFTLFQNYPNPFNPKTVIRYTVGAQNLVPLQHVDLSIYNILGQKVATQVNKKQTAGSYQVEWDASGFATGIYYYRIEVGEFQQMKKMILIK